MQCTFDKMRFPMLQIHRLKLDIHLLPVTKWQFERFLEEEHVFADSWYAALLDLNPRTSYRRFNHESYCRLFVTGILPHEAQRYARWMGEGYDLPTLSEWRTIAAHVKNQAQSYRLCLNPDISSPALTILQRLSQIKGTEDLYQMMLFEDGVVEWVSGERCWVGVGHPPLSLHPNVWNPFHDVVKVHEPAERLHYFGFRLVRRHS